MHGANMIASYEKKKSEKKKNRNPVAGAETAVKIYSVFVSETIYGRCFKYFFSMG